MKKLISKYHRHQLVHNFSSSEINDSAHNVASDTNFYCNMAIHFTTGAILEPRMLLTKYITDLFFNWTLDYGTYDASNLIPITLDGYSKHGCYVDHITLEHSLHLRQGYEKKNYSAR